MSLRERKPSGDESEIDSWRSFTHSSEAPDDATVRQVELVRNRDVHEDVIDTVDLLESIVFFPQRKALQQFICLPYRFKDKVLEKAFGATVFEKLRHSVCKVGRGIFLLALIFLLSRWRELMFASQHGVRTCQCIQLLSQPLLCLSALLWSIKIKFLLREPMILLMTNTIFVLFFLTSRARVAAYSQMEVATCFPGLDAESVSAASSDSFIVLSVSALQTAFYVSVPIRCRFSMLNVVTAPAIYIVMTLQVPASYLEGDTRRRLLMACLLFVSSFVGLLGQAAVETEQRIEFLRLHSLKDDLRKEKVLRFEAEHEVIRGPFSNCVLECSAAEEGVASMSAASMSATGTSLTGMIFGKPSDENMLGLQLSAMQVVAQREHWLLMSEGLKYFPAAKLGSGGYGTVFRGEYFGTSVAVKIPNLQDLSGIGSIANELRVFRRLRNPYIVAFYGAVIKDGHLVLVEEFVDGQTLQDFVLDSHSNNQVSSSLCEAQTRLEILSCICKALIYMHVQEPTVIHGDLGATNVIVQNLVCPNHVIQITDHSKQAQN
ncbi:unnamed protein product [Polarella glacialis]|uniref:Protein kinase domain-containing protein n=1 Tax=Polarella glacialis TaxID=89957 RepID=A0A813K6B2_POLGL|nr:unnamed protein product [Polarella glacialis]